MNMNPFQIDKELTNIRHKFILFRQFKGTFFLINRTQKRLCSGAENNTAPTVINKKIDRIVEEMDAFYWQCLNFIKNNNSFR